MLLKQKYDAISTEYIIFARTWEYRGTMTHERVREPVPLALLADNGMIVPDPG